MLLIVDHIMVLVREQHSREDFDIMSVLRPVIPLLAGTGLRLYHQPAVTEKEITDSRFQANIGFHRAAVQSSWE